MKYGLIIHNYGNDAGKYVGFNVGDPIQSFAVEYLYDLMGIDESNRLPIQLCDINNYDGDYIVLPLCGVAVGIQFARLPLSPRIIPVFISTHIAKNELSVDEIDYLKKYQPIGCRDEFTLQLVRRYGIDSFLSGCITTILPRRETIVNKSEADQRNIVYLVDTPKEVDSFLPSWIKQKAEYITHLLPIPNPEMSQIDAKRLCEKARLILESYKEKAALVISSRMHALVPCMAMGIPVIATFENISYRFSWLDKYLKLYSIKDFASIDWNPKPILFEEEKAQFVKLFSTQVKKTFDKYNMIMSISCFYENRDRAIYGNHYLELIRIIHNYKKDGFDYVIWGCGLIGSIVYDIMQREFPNSNLVAAVDSFVSGLWHGIQIIKPNELIDYKKAYVILASYSGASDGFKKMEELNKLKYYDYIYVASRNG